MQATSKNILQKDQLKKNNNNNYALGLNTVTVVNVTFAN